MRRLLSDLLCLALAAPVLAFMYAKCVVRIGKKKRAEYWMNRAEEAERLDRIRQPWKYRLGQ